eukprot:TRINITY_DN2114_c0_g1_i1.p1 TRINITY_DN2114_c0_g1~~TRINITY_DN2114_c0_g1_i1.p1  ORF type:complete len:228 (-),score=52.09 TRINITY_DN2114_c0_g1_i1:134-817(-)
MKHLNQADTNRDGKISREEWVVKFGDDSRFSAYDLNGDGIVDPDEWMAGQAAEREFNHMDTNHDGKIDRDEWLARYGTMEGFDQYDLDGDGIIDPDEFIKVKELKMEFRRFDTDRDGVISSHEKFVGIAKYDSLPQLAEFRPRRIPIPAPAAAPELTPRSQARSRNQKDGPRLSLRDCMRFHSPGGCPEGEKCLFDHVRREFHIRYSDECVLTEVNVDCPYGRTVRF